MTNELTIAQIITSYGRHYIVRTNDKRIYQATTRKKRVDFACGDWVKIQLINQEQVVIEEFLPRKSLLYRQDNMRSKIIAANVTQLFIVLAPIPTPSELLLQRALLAAEEAQIHAVIILNKMDLPAALNWQEKLTFYQSLGYHVVCVSALEDCSSLQPLLKNQCNIFLGQSGMGKSTLTNALLGIDRARIGDISTALDSGKHTTTHAQLYDIDENTQLIDSPGLQAFGLHHLKTAELLHYFPDMKNYIGLCRFHNCTHRQEPGCAIKIAVEQGKIRQERLMLLQSITNEIGE